MHLIQCCGPRRSPCLKLKPVSKGAKCGFRMLNVETYGGGLWHTWFDRDLSVAGRALLREGERLVHRLVRTPGSPQQGVLPTCILPLTCLRELPGMRHHVEAAFTLGRSRRILPYILAGWCPFWRRVCTALMTSVPQCRARSEP